MLHDIRHYPKRNTVIIASGHPRNRIGRAAISRVYLTERQRDRTPKNVYRTPSRISNIYYYYYYLKRTSGRNNAIIGHRVPRRRRRAETKPKYSRHAGDMEIRIRTGFSNYGAWSQNERQDPGAECRPPGRHPTNTRVMYVYTHTHSHTYIYTHTPTHTLHTNTETHTDTHVTISNKKKNRRFLTFFTYILHFRVYIMSMRPKTRGRN